MEKSPPDTTPREVPKASDRQQTSIPGHQDESGWLGPVCLGWPDQAWWPQWQFGTPCRGHEDGCYLREVAALGEEAGDAGCGGVAGFRAGLATEERGGAHKLSARTSKEGNPGAR